MPKIVGYARVSTKDQDLNSQIDSLKSHGCDEANIFSDIISGVKSKRDGLTSCLGSVANIYNINIFPRISML